MEQVFISFLIMYTTVGQTTGVGGTMLTVLIVLGITIGTAGAGEAEASTATTMVVTTGALIMVGAMVIKLACGQRIMAMAIILMVIMVITMLFQHLMQLDLYRIVYVEVLM